MSSHSRVLPKGGDLDFGSRICIESWQNSWQGGTISQKLVALDGLDNYLVKMEGYDCERQAPSALADKRRALMRRSVTGDLTGDDIWENFDESNQNAQAMSLGAGSSTYNLKLVNSTVVSASIFNYLGYTLYNIIIDISNLQSITFTPPSAATCVGLIARMDDRNIAVNYVAQNASAVPSSTSMSSGIAATSPAEKSDGSNSWHKANWC